MDRSDHSHYALRLGCMIKHNMMRSDIVEKMYMPRAVEDKFELQYYDLRALMEETLCLVLPSRSDYACANGFDDTEIVHVFYGDGCTRKNCICHEDYSFIQHPERCRRRNKAPTWRQLETLLFIVDMHSNILDMSEKFSEAVMNECKRRSLKFSRTFFGTEILNRKKLAATIAKERKMENVC